MSIKIGLIGCGQHAFMAILPSLQYTPLELAAVADIEEHAARRAARMYGAPQVYTDYRKMLAEEELDAILALTGEQFHPQIAIEALRAGKHVWIEKPPAPTLSAMEQMAQVAAQSGKVAQIGYMANFFPAVRKAKAIATTEKSFGRLTAFRVRYCGSGAPRPKPEARPMLLTVAIHPIALFVHLGGGAPQTLYCEEGPGEYFITAKWTAGHIGFIHYTQNRSFKSFDWEVELCGSGRENLFLLNGDHLRYYRFSHPRPVPGKKWSELLPQDFTTDLDKAPLFWEPSFDHSLFANNILFLAGYVPELQEFARRIEEGHTEGVNDFAFGVQTLRVFEAFMQPSGQVVNV